VVLLVETGAVFDEMLPADAWLDDRHGDSFT
jgi:hypothetical protein